MQSVRVSLVAQPFAIARSSDSGGKKSRSRKTKDERKSMVKIFVNKYRASNNGNFPSLNITHKEVGGSFYTVREIVREIIQENRVLGPATPISENENVVQDLEISLSLSHVCGTTVTLSQVDVESLPSEEEVASETSFDRDDEIVKQKSARAHGNHSHHCIVSEPVEINKSVSDQSVRGLPNLINNGKVVEETTIALPGAAFKNYLGDLTSNTTVEVWDPISDAKGLHCSNRIFAPGLTEAPQAKQAISFDPTIEDLFAFNGEATVCSRVTDASIGFIFTETSQLVESDSPSVCADQDWQAGGARIAAAPKESLLQNALVDSARNPSDLSSPVSKQKELVGIEANKNHCNDKEVLDDKTSGHSPNFPPVDVANPFWDVIKSWITSFVKFWVE